MQKTTNRESSHGLGDFLTTPRLVPISLISMLIGAISAFVAALLLRLIGLFTNLFFFQRWATDLVSPAGNHFGVLVIFVPVIGALIIGCMARYGSERIRGHGIPEAIEAILINGSRVDPKVAVLIGIRDLLHARVRTLDAEVQRERVLRVHHMIPTRVRRLIRR